LKKRYMWTCGKQFN